MRSVWAYNHGSTAIAPLSLLTEMGGAPSVTTRAGFSATSREPSARTLGDLRITVRAFRRASPHGPFTTPAAAVLCGPPWFYCAILQRAQRFVGCAERGLDVDRCIGRWAIVLWKWRFGGTAPLRYRIRPRADSHAFPGRREHQTEGVHTSRYQDLATRWLAPWRGLWLTTTPCPGSFLPGSARGADEVMDGTFLRPEAACLPLPSSLPSMAGRLQETLTFPKPRVRLRCTSARKTPPLGGIVLIPCPKPVGWRSLAAKTYSAADHATSALYAMAILWVHQAKALKCTRIVPTLGWRRSCAWWLTLPYGQRKLQCSPSGRGCPHLWSKSAIYGSA